ncbi:hypothetical protein EST38_g2599 [Candolleomyces aberdarensis]|uniref:Uncharacterized protein n=1 Tax=Candolleomyces aberdarensis TaxID=2316362 RepID=A0A4Q2DSJ1_9AGAR|nr:hypothetical protein EST38_g2599 [Candolleomyces aberdarensis]
MLAVPGTVAITERKAVIQSDQQQAIGLQRGWRSSVKDDGRPGAAPYAGYKEERLGHLRPP